MKSMALTFIVSFALCVASLPALGRVITFEPDNYEHGTDISNVNKWVSFKSVSVNDDKTGFEYGPAYSITAEECYVSIHYECDSEFVAPTGSKVFGWKDADERFRHGWAAEDYFIYLLGPYSPYYVQALQADFSRSTNYVSIKGITTVGSSDSTILMGINRDGELVDWSFSEFSEDDLVCCDSEGMGSYWSYETSISTEGNDIAYIVVGGESATTRLDHLTFNVSEPRIVPAFLVLLAGIVLFRSRSRYCKIREIETI